MSLRTCRDVRADLSAYLDGDLDAGLTGEIRVHLESCADCRSELELLRLTVGALHRLPDLPPPAAILAGVRARLRPEPWHLRLLDGRQWLLGMPVGALATVLIIVGISLFQARYPDMPQTVMHSPSPESAAPPAPEHPAKPAPIARSRVADRQTAPPPVAAQPAAPTPRLAVRSKVRQSQPSRPEPRVATPKDAEFSARAAVGSARQGRTKLAEDKATVPNAIRVVCLLPPDGYTVVDLERLLRREGALDIAVNVLDSRAIHEAFAPHRLRLDSLPEPSHGWTVTASVPPRALARLIDTLASRTSLRILERPAAPIAHRDLPGEQNLRIMVLR